MSKSGLNLELLARVAFLVLLAVVVVAYALVFLIVFVPVVGWYLWRVYDKMKKLEERLSKLEKPADQKSDEP